MKGVSNYDVRFLSFLFIPGCILLLFYDGYAYSSSSGFHPNWTQVLLALNYYLIFDQYHRLYQFFKFLALIVDISQNFGTCVIFIRTSLFFICLLFRDFTQNHENGYSGNWKRDGTKYVSYV